MKVKAKRNLKEKKPKRERNIMPKWKKNKTSAGEQKHLKDHEKSIQKYAEYFTKALKELREEHPEYADKEYFKE